ncbi:respiratory nitrate reductase subunit gamma [Sporolactobacillus sp. CQH2019]|uniref:respiratory nitrate reductase subunit gamma n=1 Tax=Sporolactobacillus sp. CQH2019 TaxID=3023512 RepID=UPI002368E379|nr:respiratory nitrate reductase subunit gamma [Sporolactobacillus sp. CQH2019]MDD9149597.1 respiratory nitrate reductase subunit gamma [Sporolactobacillus sp. CQH2019]
MTHPFQYFLWIIFPYIALGSFFFGTILRLTLFNSSITAVSSELLEKHRLIIGSISFHTGIILVFLGHILGILIPKGWIDALGISEHMYHIFGSILMGGLAGVLALVGMLLLTWRRFSDVRVFRTSSLGDLIVNIALLITIILGLIATLTSSLHPAFNYRTSLSVWARQLFTFYPDLRFMLHVPLIYKLHVICGFLILGMFPYTRLMHALVLPWQYVFRRFIIYRRKPQYDR